MNPTVSVPEPSPEARADKAFVRRLNLTQFRNHARLDIEADAGPVCLFGPNGAGKTNILEALSLLGPGRGLRGADLDEMARQGEDGGLFAVAGLFQLGSESRRIGVGLERTAQGQRRVARIDGKDAGPKDLAETVRLLWLTPAYDRLFAGPAGERRRFLDRLVFAIAPEHGQQAALYDKAMRERTRLLEEPNPDQRWLSLVEAEAAAAAIALGQARLEAVDALQSEISQRPDGAFPKAGLALEGWFESSLRQAQNAASAEADFIRHLHDCRPRDRAAGRALDGPHRCDLTAIHTPSGMPAQKCSTGEQKALVVTLILAQARRIASGLSTAKSTGVPGPNPLVLLDEAAAHFDPSRRAALCEELLALPGQAWLTGTDRNLFEDFGSRASLFDVSPGQVRAVQ
ncbi:DNA replication and repair protein RecF [Candidatus Phycosocius bacilliformis]|uniref:DNA replication and repair protein RecF n=1 Tax=Candidatus Phycosocius bacilliformis TaxID=1445552 RepID=A0A2P2E9B1_9PROT|nr:DNA replication/repair protein RecF [Candidatus Phycosocius bacilliformis]GBF57645.1 DNA replication and repair protein RecF [Candidatus Phycosocius bacilliformis]